MSPVPCTARSASAAARPAARPSRPEPGRAPASFVTPSLSLMFSAFANSMKIPELRSRILYTLGLLFVARVGAHLPLPGVDPKPLQLFFADQTAAGGGGL